MSGVKWLRQEFEGREDLLETRADFKKRTGITEMSLSGHFTRYADRVPKVVKKFGKLKYFAADELDGFIKWIEENSGTRTPADIKRADIARLTNAIEDIDERIETHRLALEKAEKERVRVVRDRKRAQSDLDFLEQAG
jgi:hypothetical protein